MKNFTQIFSALLLINFVAQSQVSKQFSFSENDVEIGQANGYDVVNLKTAFPLNGEEHVSEPQLPVFYANFLLPKGAIATSVTINVGSSSSISGNFTIFPVQTPQTLNFGNSFSFKNPNPETYCSNTPFPENPLLEYTNHRYREYTYVKVGFIPFEYVPSSGNLSLYTNISVTVNYSINGTAEQKLRPDNAVDDRARKLMAKTVVNASQMAQFYPEQQENNLLDPPTSPTIYGMEYETTNLPAEIGHEVLYVIITNNTNVSGENVGDLVGEFAEFAKWKTLMGVPAKVMSVDAIRAEYEGNDVPEKIRKFIQEAHQQWGTEYVLLGGNASIVPVRWYYGNYMPTDLYYAAICDAQGNYKDWDANNDGQYWDGAEFTPDIAVGRAPVDTEAEVTRFKKKNFTYGRFSDFSPLVQNIPNGIWLNRQLNAHGVCFSDPWDYSSNGLRVGYDIIKAHHDDTNIYGMFEYFENWETDHPDYCPAYYPLFSNGQCNTGQVDIINEKLTLANIMAQIDDGYGFINILDHMGTYRIGLGRETGLANITASDFQALSDDGGTV